MTGKMIYPSRMTDVEMYDELMKFLDGYISKSCPVDDGFDQTVNGCWYFRNLRQMLIGLWHER